MPKLLAVELGKDPQGHPCWKVTFQIWPERAPYAVFLAADAAEDDIVRLARKRLGEEFAALAKTLAGAP